MVFVLLRKQCTQLLPSIRREISTEMTVEMVPKLCLFFIVCSVIATRSSSFIDQAKPYDEVLQTMDHFEKRLATFEAKGVLYIYSVNAFTF